MALVLDVCHDYAAISLNEHTSSQVYGPALPPTKRYSYSSSDESYESDYDVYEYDSEEEKHSYEEEDDNEDDIDVSSTDDEFPDSETKQMKIDLIKWYRSRQGVKGLVDTTGALFMDFDDLKVEPADILPGLIDLMIQCRLKTCISFFDYPGDRKDGGYSSSYLTELSKMSQDYYTAIALEATQQYNRIADQDSKLELVSVTKVVGAIVWFGLSHMFITLTARRKDQTGTYQAAVARFDVTYLIFLRYVEEDKVLAYTSIPWVEGGRLMGAVARKRN